MFTTNLEIAEEFLVKEVTAKLKEYNIQTIGCDDSSDLYAFVIRSEEGEMVGASIFKVLWGQLHIRYLVIDEKYRKHKFGTLLMEKTILWGKTNGCTIAHIETLSFQALDFYLKLDFILEYTKTGYSHGVKLHYLRKDI